MDLKKFEGIFLRIDRDGFIQPDRIIASSYEHQKVIEKISQIILRFSWLIRIIGRIF